MTAGLATLINQCQHGNDECRRRCQIIDRVRAQGSQEAYEAACLELLGGEFPCNVMAGLLLGITHLAGRHIVFDFDSTDGAFFVPVPPCLSFMTGQQMVAMNSAVANEAMETMSLLRSTDTIYISEGVSCAIFNLFNIAGKPPPKQFKVGTPEEAVAFCRQQLRKGKTWDGGMRRLVSLNYRGTIMSGVCCRLVGALPECFKHLKWARGFIELAEKMWNVQSNCDYAQKGSCFLTSFQVNVMVMELEVYDLLRGDSYIPLKGAYPLDGFFNLARKTAAAASSPFGDNDCDLAGVGPYQRMSLKIAFHRKPIALVHGGIASVTKRCTSEIPNDIFVRLLVDTGLINADDTRSPYAIIAEHYCIAAEAQLPDADDAAILWWGAAANMAEAPETDGFTLGKFRYAMEKADAACRARAVEIFGPDTNHGGSYQTECRLVLEYYAGESDSFVLPKLCIVSRRNGILDLKLDGEILCENFEDYLNREKARREETMEKFSEVEEKYGMDGVHEEIPSLTILCVRELHKSDCSYATGESDPCSIHLKAIAAGAL